MLHKYTNVGGGIARSYALLLGHSTTFDICSGQGIQFLDIQMGEH